VRALIGNKLYLSIPEHGTYNISLYRFDGKKVLNLTRQFSQAGDAVVQFNKKKNIPGMVYLVKVTGEKCSVQSKVVVY
jgi:hypothetical protein